MAWYVDYTLRQNGPLCETRTVIATSIAAGYIPIPSDYSIMGDWWVGGGGVKPNA